MKRMANMSVVHDPQSAASAFPPADGLAAGEEADGRALLRKNDALNPISARRAMMKRGTSV